MIYTCSRSKIKIHASEAIQKGLNDDGGLFVPIETGKLELNEAFIKQDYKSVAFDVLRLFLDDFTDEEIKYCIDSAYNADNFPEGEVSLKSFDGMSFLELFKGPTAAFKDMALTMLPFLMEVAKKKSGTDKKTVILVATSGDTGSAALSSFIRAKDTATVVIYPNGGVSQIQEKQMLYYTDEKTRALAMDGNFDDCQNLVKEIFENNTRDDIILSSANSINIGRLLPQIIYYVYSYAKLAESGKIKLGEKINVIVPTGNFGDILAGYLAGKIGIPVNKFVCASNKNKVLFDFFKTGEYNRKREFFKTNSPAMDILISSNLERLLYYISGCDEKVVSGLMHDLKEKGEYKISEELKKNLNDFEACWCDSDETEEYINRAYKEYGYVLDPHTATGYKARCECGGDAYDLIVSTASPFKFPSTICSALNITGGKDEIEKIKLIEKTGAVAPQSILKLLDSEKPTCLTTKEGLMNVLADIKGSGWRM